ncbi:MAG: hypothetical protein RIQ89_1057 [Bacteroidota bacterium]|jgi:hypothetical protein
MKRILTLLVAAFLAPQCYSTVLTVSNQLTSPGQFQTLNAAISAATSGDTLLVHGSPYNYGTITLNKSLTLIGPGHLPDKQSPVAADLDSVYLQSGASSSKFIGLVIANMRTSQAAVTNVRLYGNKIKNQIRFDFNGHSQWLLDGNVFEYNQICLYGTGMAVPYMTVRNNIFNGWIQDFNNTGNSPGFTLINNLFLNPTTAFTYLFSAVVQNNIFYRSSPSFGFASNSCTYSKNVSYQCSNNNFANGVNFVNTNPLFTNFPATGALFDYAHNYRIQAASTVKNGGTDGTDPGVYGGPGDFNQGGMPHVPIIKSFNITSPTVIQPGGTLTISVKSIIR